MLSDLKEALSQKKGRGSDPEKIQNKRKREDNDGYAEMKRMAMTERGEGSVYQEPARGQETNDDDDDDYDTNIVLCSCHTDEEHKTNTVLIFNNVDREKCYYYYILNCYYYK